TGGWRPNPRERAARARRILPHSRQPGKWLLNQVEWVVGEQEREAAVAGLEPMLRRRVEINAEAPQILVGGRTRVEAEPGDVGKVGRAGAGQVPRSEIVRQRRQPDQSLRGRVELAERAGEREQIDGLQLAVVGATVREPPVARRLREHGAQNTLLRSLFRLLPVTIEEELVRVEAEGAEYLFREFNRATNAEAILVADQLFFRHTRRII